ncbi:MAG: putative toxin-antitoxin system toxin component, PIN family [bacterium]
MHQYSIINISLIPIISISFLTLPERLPICISQQVLDELYEKIREKFGFSENRVEEVITFIQENAVMFTHDTLFSPICRDPDDDYILALAVSGNVDCLISGDEDLLILKSIQGIPILKPNDFWKFEKEKSGWHSR